MTNRPLTERDYEILSALQAHEQNMTELGLSRGAHPMDLGGRNGTHHSATLNKLVRHGLASRSYPPRPGHRGSQRYKLTDEGRRIITEHMNARHAEYMRQHAETITALGLPPDTTPLQLRRVQRGVLVWRDGQWEMSRPVEKL